MSTPAEPPLVAIGDNTYPADGETVDDALTRLVEDTVAATGPLTRSEELRLRQLIIIRRRSYHDDYRKLREFFGSYVASFGKIGEAVAYLSTTPGFRRGGIVFRSEPDLAELKKQLDGFPNVHAVIGGVPPAVVAKSGLASRAIVADAGKHFDVCAGLMALLSGMPLKFVGSVSEPSIYQTPQERADMHDIRPLLLLDKKQTVTVCVPDLDTWGDAAEILNYYIGFGDRVFVTFRHAPERNRARGVLHATDATRRLLDMALSKDIRPALAEATAGPAQFAPAEREAYIKDLVANGWVQPRDVIKKLIIVNFRDSGHVNSLAREASHPELDTGTDGFRQLIKLAADKGTAVPMGHRGDLTPDAAPSLIEYWKWPCCQEVEGQPRRLREYRLLRFIAQSFGKNVAALALRSGSTDALSYCGISLVSVDLALEGASRDDAIARKLVLLNENKELIFPHGHPGSWRQTIKRLFIAPQAFHQVYITHLRDDNGKLGPDWPGAFAPEDLDAITRAYDLYISKEEHDTPPPNSPLLNPGFAKALTLFYDPALAQGTRQASKVVDEAIEELVYLVALIREFRRLLK